MSDSQKFIIRAETAIAESRHLDFKREFDASSAEAWCGLIKDIIAIANSGGGVIVFGILDDGTESGIDVGPILSIDSAEFTNKILKYTNYQFSDLEIVVITRDSKSYPAVLIQPTDVPIVFIKPGTYEVADKKQKTAFSQGTVYFRHGSKSEPGTRDDLQRWFKREIQNARREWLSGIRKVVEAPPDHTVTVSAGAPGGKSVKRFGRVRLSGDPKATGFVPTNAEEIWPHRQQALLQAVNRKLPNAEKINGHDVFCLNRCVDILNARPEFAYKPHKLASPQYSDEYAEWILDQHGKDREFFRRAREEIRKQNIAAQGTRRKGGRRRARRM